MGLCEAKEFHIPPALGARSILPPPPRCCSSTADHGAVVPSVAATPSHKPRSYHTLKQQFLSCQSPPSPWQQHTNPTSGHVYYWNPLTAQSQYERPKPGPEPLPKGLYPQVRAPSVGSTRSSGLSARPRSYRSLKKNYLGHNTCQQKQLLASQPFGACMPSAPPSELLASPAGSGPPAFNPAFTAPPAVFVPDAFYDIMTGAIMEDPVMAEDNRTYSRASITGWFAQCQAQELPTTSPWTRELVGVTLRDNADMRRAIEDFKSSMQQQNATWAGGCAPADGVPAGPPPASVVELADIFEKLDGLRGMLGDTLEGWEPPQLVVIGNEKTGKSTLLERICMMPIFPHADELCTRMRIQVRLRRKERHAAPRLQVINLKTGEIEGPTITIPLDTAQIDVRDAMERIVRQQNAGVTGVINTHALRLYIESPHVPTLDLIDMPGLVTTSAIDEPQDMPAQTLALIEDQIRRNKDNSLFLCVMHANTAPNTTQCMKIIKEHQLEARTVGVITMCDELPQKRYRMLHERIHQRGDAVALEPHGYIATMNAPIGEQHETNDARLQRQAREEPDFFEKKGLGSLVSDQKATTGCLVKVINHMFLDYVKRSWVPTTVARLDAEAQALTRKDLQLGLPAVDGTATGDALVQLQQLVADSAGAVLMGMLQEQKVQRVFSRKMHKLCKRLHADPALVHYREASVCTVSIDSDQILLAHLVSDDAVQHIAQAVEHIVREELQQIRSFELQWIRDSLEQETEFKLARLPTVVDALVAWAESILDSLGPELLGCSKTIALDLMDVAWDFESGTRTASFGLSRLASCIVDAFVVYRANFTQQLLYAPEGCSTASMDVVSGRSVLTVVQTYIVCGTKEACQAERLQLKNDRHAISKAVVGVLEIVPEVIANEVQRHALVQHQTPKGFNSFQEFVSDVASQICQRTKRAWLKELE